MKWTDEPYDNSVKTRVATPEELEKYGNLTGERKQADADAVLKGQGRRKKFNPTVIARQRRATKR